LIDGLAALECFDTAIHDIDGTGLTLLRVDTAGCDDNRLVFNAGGGFNTVGNAY
jgi:hypothetical protein